MSNIGKKITDFYCNGFAGRRYDLEGGIIESEGYDWIVIRLPNGETVFMSMAGYDKDEYIEEWTAEKE